jgi:hypothetical protein
MTRFFQLSSWRAGREGTQGKAGIQRSAAPATPTFAAVFFAT